MITSRLPLISFTTPSPPALMISLRLISLQYCRSKRCARMGNLAYISSHDHDQSTPHLLRLLVCSTSPITSLRELSRGLVLPRFFFNVNVNDEHAKPWGSASPHNPIGTYASTRRRARDRYLSGRALGLLNPTSRTSQRLGRYVAKAYINQRTPCDGEHATELT
jgi:hypothetical protein